MYFACEEYVFSLPEIEELLGHEIASSQVTDDLLVTPAPAAKIQRNKAPDHGKRNGRGPRRNNDKNNQNRNNKRRRKPKPDGGSRPAGTKQASQ